MRESWIRAEVDADTELCVNLSRSACLSGQVQTSVLCCSWLIAVFLNYVTYCSTQAHNNMPRNVSYLAPAKRLLHACMLWLSCVVLVAFTLHHTVPFCHHVAAAASCSHDLNPWKKKKGNKHSHVFSCFNRKRLLNVEVKTNDPKNLNDNNIDYYKRTCIKHNIYSSRCLAEAYLAAALSLCG